MGVLFLALLGLGLVSPASAAEKASIVIDVQSGKVLEADDPDAPRYPASLTKVMTLYLLFEDLEAGQVRLDDLASVSARAASQAPSELGVKAGSKLAIKDAMLGLVTKSANDAAVVVAEHLSGSVEAFAARMTAKAHALGMTRTTFRNPNGLPDPEQTTTARDLALLGVAIQQHFPEHYKIFSTRSFRYGKKVHKNHNRLLGRVDGIDGIKTGYTRASGYNLLSSFRRGGRHLVAVVLGHQSGRKRDTYMQGLITASLPKASSRPVNPIVVAKVPRAGGPVVAAVSTPPAPATPATPRILSEGDAVAAAPPVLPPSASALAQPQPLPSAVRRKAKAAAKVVGMVPPPQVRPIQGAPAVEPAPQDEVAQVSVPESQDAPKDAPTGKWAVQVGVTPTESGAATLLDAAKEKANDLLDSAAPMTEKIERKNKVMYRARFAGLDRAEAKEVCKVLKKSDLACFATRN